MDRKKKRSNYRNQCIGNKFFAQKPEIKDTHPHIVEWLDSTNCRATKTEIIENCFKKNGGTWKLDLEKPFFTEAKKRCVGSRGAYVSLQETLESANCIIF